MHAQAPDFNQDPYAEPAADPFNNTTSDARFDAAGTGGSGSASSAPAPQPAPSEPAKARTPGVETPLLVGAVLLLAVAMRRR